MKLLSHGKLTFAVYLLSCVGNFCRGGSTWRPSVTPLSSPAPTPTGVNLLTKTSLAANARTPTPNIGGGHNSAAKPFAVSEP